MLFWIFAKWIFTRTFSPQSSWIVMTRPEGEQKLLAFTNCILWKVFQAYCDLFLLCLALSRLARLAELRDEICPKFWQISRRRRRRPQVRSTLKKGGQPGNGDRAGRTENHPTQIWHHSPPDHPRVEKKTTKHLTVITHFFPIEYCLTFSSLPPSSLKLNYASLAYMSRCMVICELLWFV